MDPVQEELREMRGQMGKFMGDMQNLIQDQKMLKEEVNQLKVQMSLVMEVVRNVLKKSDDPMPGVIAEIVVPPVPRESMTKSELPHGLSIQSGSSGLSHQQLPLASPDNPKGKRHLYRPKNSERIFDPIPMSYAQLLGYLLQFRLVELRPMRTPTGRLPPSYNVYAQCNFHSGALGHDVEDCYAFQHIVQDLIDLKTIEFTSGGMSVQGIHVPVDTGEVNVSVSPHEFAPSQEHLLQPMALEPSRSQVLFAPKPNLKRKTPKREEGMSQSQQQRYHMKSQQRPERKNRQFDPVTVPYNYLLARLLQESLIELGPTVPIPYPLPLDYDKSARCEYHSGSQGHTIENCKVFRGKVQDLINAGLIIFTKGGLYVN